MREDTVRGFLGLAMKSGILVAGAEKTIAEIARRKIALVLIDLSIADNTKKRILAACTACSVPVMPLRPELLGSSTGRPGMMAAGLRPGAMADRIGQELDRVPEQQQDTLNADFGGRASND